MFASEDESSDPTVCTIRTFKLGNAGRFLGSRERQKPVSPLDESGSAGAGNGGGSAANELGADYTALLQFKAEEPESQAPIVKTCSQCPSPQEVDARQASGHVHVRGWCRHWCRRCVL